MTKNKSWRDVLPVHPAADLFPMMTSDELAALGENIKAHGLKVPVVLWQGPDHQKVLLDGRNRLDAMETAGMMLADSVGRLYDKVAQKTLSHDSADPFAYVVSANIHRRHLTAEQKRGLIAELLKAEPEKSNRQIAATVKVSHPTVAAVRQGLETSGDVEKVSTRVDTAGRSQPARKPWTLSSFRKATEKGAKNAKHDTVDAGAEPDGWTDERKELKRQIDEYKFKAKDAKATQKDVSDQLQSLQQELAGLRDERHSLQCELDRVKHSVALSNEDTPGEIDSEAKFREWLYDEYRAAGIDLLENHADDELAQASLAEFVDRAPLNIINLAEIMAAAGQKAALTILERHHRDWHAAQPRPEPKPEPKRRRR